MKKYMKFLIVPLLTVIFISLSTNLSYAKKNIDYVNEIVKISNGKIEECGLRVSATIVQDHSTDLSSKMKEKICLDILAEYKKYISESLNITIQKTDLNYCAAFQNSLIDGYIQINNIDDESTITFKVQLKTEKNQLADMKNQMYNILKLVADKNKIKIDENNVKNTSYIKAKLPDENISTANDEIIMYLKKQKAKNIDTINIDNGFSTVANTGQYEKMGNANFDFNFMLNKYLHGSYLVVGTPVIDIDFEQ